MVIETYKKEIDIPTYVDKYVNVEEFLEKCKECPNYNQVWTCPPFDFSPEDYWKKYSTMELVAKKIILSPDERNGDWIAVLAKVNKELTAELFEMEKCDKDETDVQKAVLQIQKKFGKNAMIKAHSLEEFGTTIERNKQIGGHKA